MIEVNSSIIIVHSKPLNMLRLNGLAGRNGIVIEDLNYDERINKGFLVKLEVAYLGEYIWFVPTESCCYVQ